MSKRHALGRGVGNGLIDAIRHKNCPHWRISRGQAFGGGQEVRRQTFVFTAEHRPGAAKSCDDFIHDEQNTQFAASVLHCLGIAFRRHDHTA